MAFNSHTTSRPLTAVFLSLCLLAAWTTLPSFASDPIGATGPLDAPHPNSNGNGHGAGGNGNGNNGNGQGNGGGNGNSGNGGSSADAHEQVQEDVRAEQEELEQQDREELEAGAEAGERASQVALGVDYAKEAQLLTFAPTAANDAASDAIRWYSIAAQRGFPGAPSLDLAGVKFYPVRVQRTTP